MNALEARLVEVSRRLEREPDSVDALFEKAQLLARLGRDDEAKAGFVAVLQRDAAHFGALIDLGGLALATGYRSAAITAYRQAVAAHPDNPFGLVNLANCLLEDENLDEARQLYEKALAIDPALAFAHQGLASVLAKEGDEEGAARHREQGFAGHSVVARPYRGTGKPLRVLLIVSSKGGNIPTNIILDDRIFAVTAIYAEHFNPASPLPEHDIIFNAVGDADLCGRDILDRVETIAARSRAPIINPVRSIRDSGRFDNAKRLSSIEDIVVPRTLLLSRENLLAADTQDSLRREGFAFPLLVRSPGFHTGQNFVRVEAASDLESEIHALPGTEFLVIAFLDARGPDGMTRKYRVMFIDGKMYPLHLAMSRDWKVHYFTSAMAEEDAFRSEEARFLEAMDNALGARAMKGLERVRDNLKLDYCGIDFGLAADGRVIVFEANATMAIVPPAADPIWDYRRVPINRAIDAARTMLFKRAGHIPPAMP